MSSYLRDTTLATAADPRSARDLEPSFVEILKQLSPVQAQVLETIYIHVEAHRIEPERWNDYGIFSRELRAKVTLDEEEFRIAVDNLMRLRLLAFPATFLDFVNNSNARFQLANTEILCPTHLGRAFVLACRNNIEKQKATDLESEKPAVGTSLEAAVGKTSLDHGKLPPAVWS